MNRQFCMLPPLGARTAASRILACASTGMASGFTRRIARVVYSASKRSITTPCSAARLPGVRFGRRSARAREDLVERLQRVLVELQLDRAQRRALELFERPRADDRCRHAGLMQKPCERHGRRFLSQLRAQLLPPFELRPHPLVARLNVLAARGVA